MTLPEPLCTPLPHVCHVYCFRNGQLKATRMVCCEENPIVSARCHVVATPQPKLLNFNAWTVCRERSVAQNPMAYINVYHIFSYGHSRFGIPEFRTMWWQRNSRTFQSVQPRCRGTTSPPDSMGGDQNALMRNWDPKERDLKLVSKLNPKYSMWSL